MREMYQYKFTEPEQHAMLATALRATPYRWMLSYDDHPLIHELYQGYDIQKVSWAYTINSKKDHSGTELLILKGVALPEQWEPLDPLIEELFGSPTP